MASRVDPPKQPRAQTTANSAILISIPALGLGSGRLLEAGDARLRAVPA
jgi:hypothetical protein